MARPGIDIVELGTNVKEAGDYQRILSSRGPILPILKQFEINLAVDTSSDSNPAEMLLHKHDLGYFTPFFVVLGSTSPTKAYTYLNTIPQFRMYRNRLVYKPLAFQAASGNTWSGYVVEFDYNLENEFFAETAKTSPSNPRSSKLGLKILKTGIRTGGMSSNDIRDYSINTNARPMSIHRSGIAFRDRGGVSTTIDVAHNLGYVPFFATWLIAGYNGYPGGLGTQVEQYITVTGSQVKAKDPNTLQFLGFSTAQALALYYLIFKDPVLADTR